LFSLPMRAKVRFSGRPLPLSFFPWRTMQAPREVLPPPQKTDGRASFSFLPLCFEFFAKLGRNLEGIIDNASRPTFLSSGALFSMAPRRDSSCVEGGIFLSYEFFSSSGAVVVSSPPAFRRKVTVFFPMRFFFSPAVRALNESVPPFFFFGASFLVPFAARAMVEGLFFATFPAVRFFLGIFFRFFGLTFFILDALDGAHRCFGLQASFESWSKIKQTFPFFFSFFFLESFFPPGWSLRFLFRRLFFLGR